jgi:hypothetical protein
MKKTNLLGVTNHKKFMRELALSKKRNFEDNMKFVTLHAEWLKRTNNKEWSKRRKLLVDSLYRANRHLKLTSKRH